MGDNSGVKDWEAYENNWDKTCYIPELFYPFDDEEDRCEYTHNDLLKLVNGDKELCDQLFSILEWTFPETLVEENLNDGMWGYCESCDQYFDTHDDEMETCPKCGAKLED